MPSGQSHDCDIFISHSASDHEKLGKLLRDILESMVLDGQEGKIYYTSEPGSIPFDGEFDDMLTALDRAKAIVALATEDSTRKTSVIAEMALAFYQKKLFPVVPHYTGAGVLPWPFDHKQACFLHRPANIRQLVVELRRRLNLPPQLPEEIDTKCAELSAQSAAAYPPKAPPPPPTPLWKRAAISAALALPIFIGLAYWFYEHGFEQGRTQAEIKYYTVRPGTPAQIGSTRVSLVYSGTFPGKYLVRRINEFHRRRLADFQNAPAGPFAPHRPLEEETISYFQNALAVLFRGTDQKMAADLQLLARNALPSRHQHIRSKSCQELNEVDKSWCQYFVELEKRDPAQRNKFDDTCFALLVLDPHTQRARPLVVTDQSAPSINGQKLKVYAMARMSSLDDDSDQNDQSGFVVLHEVQ